METFKLFEYNDELIKKSLELWEFDIQNIPLELIQHVPMHGFKVATSSKPLLYVDNLQCCVSVWALAPNFAFASHINPSVIRNDDFYVDSEDNADFVALAAHELRAPLTVIRGYLDMLDEEIYDKVTDDQRALLDRLNVSAKRLASYVNNVLNANRYDRNHLQLKLTETTIADIVADVRKDLDLRATTVNRHIDWQIPNNLPTVAADKSSIGEVITNLVDNAIKYSNDGGTVEVTAKRSGDFVAVSVIDHGIGIARSAAEHLFTKFYRSHRSRASVGGTGIGLYISRGIIESHGGTIGVDSTEGEGSTFTFTVPIYQTVKDKLDSDNNSNAPLISRRTGYIDNHGSVTK